MVKSIIKRATLVDVYFIVIDDFLCDICGSCVRSFTFAK